MELKDFLATLPIEAISKTEILPDKITLPVEIDPEAFYKDFNSNIKSNTLTTEKALYASLLNRDRRYISSIDLLSSRLKFVT